MSASRKKLCMALVVVFLLNICINGLAQKADAVN